MALTVVEHHQVAGCDVEISVAIHVTDDRHTVARQRLGRIERGVPSIAQHEQRLLAAYDGIEGSVRVEIAERDRASFAERRKVVTPRPKFPRRCRAHGGVELPQKGSEARLVRG
jgi:hypothetical protein